jgi:hypothetical protein
MSSFTAFLDANVLHPAELRSFLMCLAMSELFRARWSNDVHEEWISSVLKKRPDISRAKLERTRELMDMKAPDALVAGYEGLIPDLDLPNPNDRHVLAAAILGRADVKGKADIELKSRSCIMRGRQPGIKVNSWPDAILSGYASLDICPCCGIGGAHPCHGERAKDGTPGRISVNSLLLIDICGRLRYARRTADTRHRVAIR